MTTNFVTCHLGKDNGMSEWGGGYRYHYITDTPVYPSPDTILQSSASDILSISYATPPPPRDYSNDINYFLYFTTPNDGITRNYKFDVEIDVTPSGGYSFQHGFIDVALNGQPVHNWTGQPFPTTAPAIWSDTWTGSFAPNEIIYVLLETSFISNNPINGYWECPVNWYITVTCLSETPIASGNIEMICEMN